MEAKCVLWYNIHKQIIMKITFLGTNGWYDSDTGNTVCTLIDAKDYYIVLDAGFGFADLNKFLTENKPVYLFLSHFHLDHTCGLHTLGKLNIKELTIFGQPSLKKYLKILVNHPFAASFSEIGCKVKLVELKPGHHKLPVDVYCLPLHHVDPAMGYRFNIEGKTVTYCSDTSICPNDWELSRNADLLIHECAFLPGHTSTWGHTNPEQAAGMAREVKVKKMILTHLGADGYNSIEKRKMGEQKAREIFPETTVATDGFTFEL